MSNFNSRIRQPYAIRKIFYGAIALVGALLLGFGVGDASQIDQWTEAAERFLAPLLMILSSTLAATKANAGSDQKAVPQPVAPAAPTAPVYPTPGEALLEELQKRINSTRTGE